MFVRLGIDVFCLDMALKILRTGEGAWEGAVSPFASGCRVVMSVRMNAY